MIMENKEARRLLGKRVTVTIQDAPQKVVVTGTLLGFGEDGEFEVQDSAGIIHYCWPALEMREYHGGE
jgi:hypothetical protein